LEVVVKVELQAPKILLVTVLLRQQTEPQILALVVAEIQPLCLVVAHSKQV
jgi:hypothetical protein